MPVGDTKSIKKLTLTTDQIELFRWLLTVWKNSSCI